MTTQPDFRRSPAGDDGIAMVLSLLFMLLLSALGTAMLLLSRSETLSSVNYRMMSQARYGAESGIHKAANFLLNSYTLPGTANDPLSNFDMTQSPVRYSGQPVVLSSLSGVTPNYPYGGTKTAFTTATQGSLAVGDATVLYTASATLLSMRTIVPYGSTLTVPVQTWRLTARGSIQGARQAEVEVSAVIERKIVPAFTYGFFAELAGCNALEFGGNVTVDSYDSSNISFVSGLPAVNQSNGHVATNGNLTVGGSTIIYGTLSTPRTGVGDCRDGAVTAYDYQGNASIAGGILKLPQQVKFTNPNLPSPMPPTTTISLNGSSTCAQVTPYITSGVCTMTGIGAPSVTLDPQGTEMALPNISVNSGATLVLKAGTYNINSLSLAGNSKLKINDGPVILNVAGVGYTTPVDLTSGSVISPTFISTYFRIFYAGTGTLKLTGGSATAATVYAPDSLSVISGGAEYFGGIVAERISISGGSKLHRDRQLEQYFAVGPQMMSLFTWKEY